MPTQTFKYTLLLVEVYKKTKHTVSAKLSHFPFTRFLFSRKKKKSQMLSSYINLLINLNKTIFEHTNLFISTMALYTLYAQPFSNDFHKQIPQIFCRIPEYMVYVLYIGRRKIQTYNTHINTIKNFNA